MSASSLRGAAAVVLGELLAVALAVLLFALFLALVGAAPLAVLGDMVEGAFGSRFSLQNALVRAAPLMLTALGTLLPARIGLVVIGNEGALLAGGLGAACAGTWLASALPGPLVQPAALALGMLRDQRRAGILVAFVARCRKSASTR